MSGRSWVMVGAGIGALGVTIGAFGAHGLEKFLAEKLAAAPAHDSAFDSQHDVEAEVQRRLETFEIGVRYQMYHAAGLVLVGLVALHGRNRWTAVAGCAMLTGVVLFSGLLYLYVVSGVKILGAIVPVGGVAYIVGWLALAVSARHEPKPN